MKRIDLIRLLEEAGCVLSDMTGIMIGSRIRKPEHRNLCRGTAPGH